MPTGIPKSGVNKGWFKKGRVPWDKGIKRPDMTGENNPSKRKEVRKKISEKLKGRNITWQQKMKDNHADVRKEKHPQWKGGISLREDYHREYGNKHWRENRERYYFYSKRRRIRKFNSAGSHTFKEWLELKKKFDYCCAICREKEPFNDLWRKMLTQDHIIPLVKGGSDSIENIQPLCILCNCKKGVSVEPIISPNVEQ